MSDGITPRINYQFLEQFTHQTVRLVGKVTQLRGENATVDADGAINVILNREAHLTLNNAAEIVGKVQPDLTVKAFVATDWGSNVDYKLAGAIVDATHKFKAIFYDVPGDDGGIMLDQ